MKGKRIIGGFLCILFLCMQPYAGFTAKGAEPSLYAVSAVLMDAENGRVLYGKNADEPMAMASTTKIMTCILILENGNLEDTLTVSGYAASMPKVRLGIKKGEQYRVKDLLYSLMLESHNDAAVALAEYIGGRYLTGEAAGKAASEYTAEESKRAVAAFAALMNQKAEELGCENTYFITPNGLDATETITLKNGETVQKEHHTTAAELAVIMSYCIGKSPASEGFLEITRTADYTFQANGRSFTCVNHNAFLTMMDGALSGKTGFTGKAGYCYVGALCRDGKCFVVALLACGWPNNKTYKWSDTKELMQYGLDNYNYKSFHEEGIAFDEGRLERITVLSGATDRLGEKAYARVRLVSGEETGEEGLGCEGMLLGAGEQVEVEYQQERVLCAPVKENTVVGKVSYIVDGVVYRTEKIVTADSVERIDWKWCVEKIWERFLGIG